MLENNEFYVIMKLTSGEQVMAVLKEEDEEYVLLESPICIKMIQILERNREVITAAPLCQFSDDNTFVLSKKDILFLKKLHHLFIPHYQRIVHEHETSTIFRPSQNTEDQIDWDSITLEEAKRRIEMLEELAKTPKDEREEERFRVFVEGNDTIN